MKDVSAAIMLVAGGLFAGGGATFAWSRVPIWRRMPVPEFVTDFDETIRRTDIVQPASSVVAAVAAIAFAFTADGSARLFAALGAGGFILVLLPRRPSLSLFSGESSPRLLPGRRHRGDATPLVQRQSRPRAPLRRVVRATGRSDNRLMRSSRGDGAMKASSLGRAAKHSSGVGKVVRLQKAMTRSGDRHRVPYGHTGSLIALVVVLRHRSRVSG